MIELWYLVPGYALELGEAPGSQSPYVMAGRTAIASIAGPTSKYGERGTTPTIEVREQIREIANSPDIANSMLIVDSPGGTVAGSKDLANDIAALAAVKPTFAYIQDMGASAGYQAASQAGRVFANDSAMIGGMGVMSSLSDMSGQAEQMGVKVHAISSGGLKSMGIPGTEITQEQINYQQSMVNRMADQYIETVATGRNMPKERVRELADGRVHIAADAAQLGLIDGVAPIETALKLLNDFTDYVRT